jgi:hypothetical protein
MTINNLDRGADDTMGVHNYIHFNPTSSKKKKKRRAYEASYKYIQHTYKLVCVIITTIPPPPPFCPPGKKKLRGGG